MDFLPILIFLILALSNSLFHGGAIESWFFKPEPDGSYKNISGIKYLNPVIYGLCALWVSHDAFFGSVMSIAMLFGQMFGINHRKVLKDKPWEMVFRGVLWSTFLALGFIISGYDPVLYIFPAMMMFPVYRIPDQYFAGHRSNRFINQVTIAELIYGGLLSLPIAGFQIVQSLPQYVH